MDPSSVQGTGPRSSHTFCLGALQAPLGNMPFVTVISPLTDEDTKGREVGHSPQAPGLGEPELGLSASFRVMRSPGLPPAMPVRSREALAKGGWGMPPATPGWCLLSRRVASGPD